VLRSRSFRSSSNATVSARASSSASDAALLELRFELPAPGLCIAARAETGAPPRVDRLRATPFAVAEVGVEARAGCRDGEVDVGSVEVLRPVGVPAGGGFLVAADISMDAVTLRE
jgi:hypothetical protein